MSTMGKCASCHAPAPETDLRECTCCGAVVCPTCLVEMQEAASDALRTRHDYSGATPPVVVHQLDIGPNLLALITTLLKG